MANALDVAKYIISKCNQEQEPVSNLQLQKILYIIQKTFLQVGSQAFEDDFEAWQIGPVIREVYNQYCGFGGSKIRLSYPDAQISDEFREITDFIIISKRKFAPWELTEEALDAAWKQTYSNGAGNYRYIPKSLIKSRCIPRLNQRL